MMNCVSTESLQSLSVYNLCKERSYPSSRFESVCQMGFQDHNPATLSTILNFCNDAKKFLEKKEKNVIAVHCKAGKGGSFWIPNDLPPS